MRILFYTYDLGPARNLIMVANEAIQRAYKVAFIDNDEIGEKNLFNPKPDIVITGLSSFKIDDEIMIGETAKKLGVPWIIIADTHRNWGRQSVKEKIKNAILIVASPLEIEPAKKFGYKQVVYLGGPPLWQRFSKIKPAKIKRPANKKIALVGGIKDASIIDNILTSVVNALKETKEKWCLIFKPHPNEWPETIDPERRKRILNNIEIIETNELTNNLLKVVDLSIHTCGATATIAAAYQRCPVIYYEDETIRQRMIKLTGTPTWFPAEAGACIKAGPNNLTNAIKVLLTKEGVDDLRKRQKKIYPLKNDDVEGKILDFINKIKR